MVDEEDEEEEVEEEEVVEVVEVVVEEEEEVLLYQPQPPLPSPWSNQDINSSMVIVPLSSLSTA